MPGSDNGIQRKGGTESTAGGYEFFGPGVFKPERIRRKGGVYAQRENTAVRHRREGQKDFFLRLPSVEGVHVDAVVDGINGYFGHNGVAYIMQEGGIVYPADGITLKTHAEICPECLVAHLGFILTGDHAGKHGAGK